MKHLTTAEARDLGVVLETNRLLLHRHGLALELTVPWPDDPDQTAVLRIQDHRDDPEGVYFADLDADDVKKARRFNALYHRVFEGRRRALGYIVQPLPTEES